MNAYRVELVASVKVTIHADTETEAYQKARELAKGNCESIGLVKPHKGLKFEGPPESEPLLYIDHDQPACLDVELLVEEILFLCRYCHNWVSSPEEVLTSVLQREDREGGDGVQLVRWLHHLPRL